MNGLNTLECFSLASLSSLDKCKTLAYWVNTTPGLLTFWADVTKKLSESTDIFVKKFWCKSRQSV